MLKGIIEFSLKHRLIVLLSAGVMVLLGIWAAGTSTTEFLPDLSSPIVSIVTERAGLAPQEIENLITRPIENTVQSLPNAVNVRSQSTSGVSIVVVTFKWGTDYYLARQFISQSLAEVAPRFPAGTNPPLLSNAASR